MFYDFWRGCTFQYKFLVSVCRVKILSYLFCRQYLSIAVIDVALMVNEFMISPVKRKITINHKRRYSYYEHFFRFIPAHRFGNNEVQVISSARWN